MYLPGTKFKVILTINLGDEIFEPGLIGEIIGGVKKMVGKAYKVKFEDGRLASIHIVIMNNQTEVITNH